MSRELRIFFALVAAVVIQGGIITGISVYQLSKICYNIYGFKIKNIDSKYVSFELILEVKNPSKVAIKIEGYDINVNLDKFKVATVKNST